VSSIILTETNIKELLRQKAESLGIGTDGRSKAELIHSIQIAEGFTPCFGTADSGCNEMGCCFRADCLCENNKTQKNLGYRPIGEGVSLADKVPCCVTVGADWVEKSILTIPPQLANRMAGTNTVHLLYDEIDEILVYEESKRQIEGLDGFYSCKAVAQGDKVYLQLRGIEPTRIFGYCWWRRPIEELKRVQVKEFDWHGSSIRDCIIVVLANCSAAIHYDQIQAKIAEHRQVTQNQITDSLARYCPGVFTGSGGGTWQLADTSQSE